MSLSVSRSHSRSLKTAPFDKLHTSSYRLSITMALSSIISEIKQDIDLKLWWPTFDAPIRGSHRNIATMFNMICDLWKIYNVTGMWQTNRFILPHDIVHAYAHAMWYNMCIVGEDEFCWITEIWADMHNWIRYPSMNHKREKSGKHIQNKRFWVNW